VLLLVVPEAHAERSEITGCIFLDVLIVNTDLEGKAWPQATLCFSPIRQGLKMTTCSCPLNSTSRALRHFKLIC